MRRYKATMALCKKELNNSFEDLQMYPMCDVIKAVVKAYSWMLAGLSPLEVVRLEQELTLEFNSNDKEV